MALDLNILSKLLKYLDEMISYLQEKQVTVSKLEDDEDLLFSVEHHLYTAVEAVINISEHLVSGLNLGHADTAKDTIKKLAQKKIIPKELSDKLGEAADMRNVLVHLYFDVHIKKITDAATEGLDDLREFAKTINAFLEKQSDN